MFLCACVLVCVQYVRLLAHDVYSYTVCVFLICALIKVLPLILLMSVQLSVVLTFKIENAKITNLNFALLRYAVNYDFYCTR